MATAHGEQIPCFAQDAAARGLDERMAATSSMALRLAEASARSDGARAAAAKTSAQQHLALGRSLKGSKTDGAK